MKTKRAKKKAPKPVRKSTRIKKQNLSKDYVKELCKLPPEEMQEKALKMNVSQQQEIYRLLSQPPN